LELGELTRPRERIAAPGFAKSEVILPGGFEILLAVDEELKSANLREAVINVVERTAEDVRLPLPETTVLQVSIPSKSIQGRYFFSRVLHSFLRSSGVMSGFSYTLC